ncbi:hypothetical protein [Microcystis phage Mvi-JY20]|uniref:P-loop containing nucleoside triphosphate hydrolase protein n=1 Tax=Microcystis phage Mvi-JY20 TaxID=3128146 RepID=A0AAX4QGK4_9CAUD
MTRYKPLRFDPEEYRDPETKQVRLPSRLTGRKGTFYANPLQELCIPYINSDSNMMIAAKTGAGKTICINMQVYRYLKGGGTVVYLAPYKTLADERFDEWSTGPFKEFGVATVSGDFKWTEDQIQRVANAQLICCTPESLLAGLVNHKSRKHDWIKKIALLVVDEQHVIVDEQRGASLESAISTLAQRNHDLRIIGVSGTLPNADEFTQWYTNLTNRPSVVVASDYQPVPIQRHFYHLAIPLRGEAYDDGVEEIYHNISHIEEQYPNDQFLIVVYTKKVGYELQKRFRRDGINVDFHSADIISREERKRIENSFRSRNVRFLICTTTLTVGVNLPARHVISTQSMWGYNPVPAHVILQAIGRAGRAGVDDRGYQHVFVSPGDDHVRIAQGTHVVSQLPNSFALQLLLAIYNGRVRGPMDLHPWYNSTLCSVQKLLPPVEELFGLPRLLPNTLAQLIQSQMIRIKDPEVEEALQEFETTKRGDICAQMMLDPVEFYERCFAMNRQVLNKPNPTEIDIAFAFGDLKAYEKAGGSDRRNRHITIDAFRSCKAPAHAQAVYNTLRNIPMHDPTLNQAAFTVKQDLKRWCGAMMRAKQETKVLPNGTLEQIYVTCLRVMRGIPERDARREYNRWRPDEIARLTAYDIYTLADAKRHPDRVVAAGVSRRRRSELGLP